MSFLDAFAPYKLVAEIAVIGGLALGAVIGFHEFCDHQQQVGYDKAKAEDAELAAKTEALNRKVEGLLKDNVIKAEANATQRETLLHDLVTASGQSSDRLRGTIQGIINGVPNATIDALRSQTTALATVLAECQVRYREMGQAADEHASDVQTLMQAWPVGTTPPAK